MSRRALNSLVKQSDGSWVCMRETSVPLMVPGQTAIPVQRGQRFSSGTAFAGHSDFVAYLESVSIEEPDLAPHEWG